MLAAVAQSRLCVEASWFRRWAEPFFVFLFTFFAFWVALAAVQFRPPGQASDRNQGFNQECGRHPVCSKQIGGPEGLSEVG
jgi:hypothetical protein